MLISLSIVLLLGVLVWIFIRYTKLRVWQALTCTVFGFYTAISPLGPHIQSACVALGHLISGITL